MRFPGGRRDSRRGKKISQGRVGDFDLEARASVDLPAIEFRMIAPSNG